MFPNNVAKYSSGQPPVDWRTKLAVGLLTFDAVILAVVELLFLPLRTSGGFPLPVSVLVAMVTTPLLVVQAGKLAYPRLGLFPLTGWILAILVFGVLGPGGDRLLLADWRTLLLLAGGALPAAVAFGSAAGARAAYPRA